MNKPTLILTIIYLIIIVYFAIFNWNIFVLNLDVNLGVKVVQFPLIAGIFFFGFILFILLWLNNSFSSILLRKKLNKARKELNKLKVTGSLNIDDKLEELTKKLDELLERSEFPSQETKITG
jgi:hypothetical protein